MTLTQTEKGYPPPIEHIGLPAKIREEKGMSKKSGHHILTVNQLNFLNEMYQLQFF